MFKVLKTLFAILLVICVDFGRIHCTDPVATISWVFRGASLPNNSILTFNMGDALVLRCIGTSPTPGFQYFFAITKGSSAPTGYEIVVPSSPGPYTVNVQNAGTILYTDFSGVQQGYENLVVTSNSYLASLFSCNSILNIGIGMLRPGDSGTYFCSGAMSSGPTVVAITSSGSLTLVVNTKAGQARSTRGKVNIPVVYSALILTASKVFY